MRILAHPRAILFIASQASKRRVFLQSELELCRATQVHLRNAALHLQLYSLAEIFQYILRRDSGRSLPSRTSQRGTHYKYQIGGGARCACLFVIKSRFRSPPFHLSPSVREKMRHVRPLTSSGPSAIRSMRAPAKAERRGVSWHSPIAPCTCARGAHSSIYEPIRTDALAVSR